jgi:hypothetical protein
MLIGIVKAQKSIRIACSAANLRKPLRHNRTLFALLTHKHGQDCSRPGPTGEQLSTKARSKQTGLLQSYVC